MMPAFDERIRMLVHAHANPPLTLVMRAISVIGQPAILIALGVAAVAWLARTGRTRTAALFGIIVAGAEVLDQSLKLVFHRPRPVPFFGLATPAGYSFPSGHALVSFAFFGALVVYAAARRWWYFSAAAVPVAAIGYSRVYLGVHYPTDVLGGWTTAALWILCVYLAGRRWGGDRALGRRSH
jgi:undecaprenyl-diphosphatase